MIPYFNTPQWTLGPLQMDSFSFLVCLGFLVGSTLAAKRAKNAGLQDGAIYDMSILSLVFGLIGAHLTVVFIYHPERFVENPLWIFQIWSGISSWGGFVGAAIAILVYLKRKKLSFYAYADSFLFGLVPGWFLGRLGCFTAHDHPGKVTSFFLALKYPDGTIRHDLGLYEALLTIPLIVFVYTYGRRKDLKPGTLLGWIAIFYSLIRFFLDFLRAGDMAQLSEKRILGITPAQLFCVLLISVGFQILKKIRRAS